VCVCVCVSCASVRSTEVKEIWVGFLFEVDLSVYSIQIVGFSLSSFSAKENREIFTAADDRAKLCS
jgi:hypothetical protein